MGNLGWDDSIATVETRAKETLEAEGITDDLYSNLRGMREKGSAVKINFHTSSSLTRAKLAVAEKRKVYRQGYTVFLDVAKSPEELAPTRETHRMHEILTNYYNGTMVVDDITMSLKMRSVSYKNKVVVKRTFGSWQWTAEGQRLWSQDERDHCVSWCQEM